MKNEKLSISTDSTADISWCFEKYDLKVVPGCVIIGDKNYLDGIEIQPEAIFESVEKNNILPKTAGGTEEKYAEVFKSAKGKPHLHIALSPQFSLSHDNAVRAAAAFPNVTVLDSGNMSSGLGIICVLARMIADQGKSVAEIVEELKKEIPKVRATFVVDKLDYLHRGGRCSGLKLFMANLLKLHPMIYTVPYGKMLSGRKFSGSYPNVVKQYTKYIISEYPDANKDFVFVTHTRMDDETIVPQVIVELKAAGFKEVYDTILGSTLTAHCGRNTLGILLREK